MATLAADVKVHMAAQGAIQATSDNLEGASSDPISRLSDLPKSPFSLGQRADLQYTAPELWMRPDEDDGDEDINWQCNGRLLGCPLGHDSLKYACSYTVQYALIAESIDFVYPDALARCGETRFEDEGGYGGPA
ncbi:hypothetical protein PG984_016071 [Apiospora sp. TS-2023a]